MDNEWEKALNMGMVTIVDDRYGGGESGARWLAWRCQGEDIPVQSDSPDDWERENFWKTYTGIVGKGNTPDNALADLYEKVQEFQAKMK